MRVVGGVWRHRRIQVPAEPELRPTSDRTREAIFNMAFGIGLPQDAIVVDAYCGSGALGIEALSRGAAHVTFVDKSTAACDSVQQTLETFEAAPDSYRIVCADALVTLQALPGLTIAPSSAKQPCPEQSVSSQPEPASVVDLLLIDPPYSTDPWRSVLELTPSVLIAEAEHTIEVPADSGWEQYRTRRYGRAHISILVRHDIDHLRYRQPSEPTQ